MRTAFFTRVHQSTFEPRTYTQIHTATGVHVFDMLQYFETILPSVESLLIFSTEMTYILWVMALLEACDVTNNGCHPGRHLGFYQGLEIGLKKWLFFLLDMKNNT